MRVFLHRLSAFCDMHHNGWSAETVKVWAGAQCEPYFPAYTGEMGRDRYRNKELGYEQ
jgi:hypothetical protein